MIKSLVLVMASFAAFWLAPLAPAVGSPRSGEGYVVAYSRHGNGSVSGPVRATSLGYQVRLPNGRWAYCRRSCAETLRLESIDYAENDAGLTGRGTFLNECGIFGCLDIRVPLP